MRPDVRLRQQRIQAKSRELRQLIQDIVKSEEHRDEALLFAKTAEMWAVDGCVADEVLDHFGGSTATDEEKF